MRIHSIRSGAAALAQRSSGEASCGPHVRELYAYPYEHLAFWSTVRAQARVAGWGDFVNADHLRADLLLEGVLESQVWIGDVLRFTTCSLVVTGPRIPCAGFDRSMGFAHASRLMRQSAWAGFFLSFAGPGELRAGASFELVPGPREVGVVELFRTRTGR